MHAIVTFRNKLFGKICDYNTENQWAYIKNVNGIHKSFEFVERLCDSFDLPLSYKFNACLLESTQVDAKTSFKLNNVSLAKILPLLKHFIEKCCAHDQVFQKSIDLLNIIEAIVSYYPVERPPN